MILRFMGDMPEPKVMQSPQEKESTSLAKKLYGSLSKKFSGSKLAEELGEVRLGERVMERVGRGWKSRTVAICTCSKPPAT